MEHNDFKIGVNTVWCLFVCNLLFIIIGAFAKIQNWEYPEVFLTIGLILFFSAWIITFSDMVKNNIYNKTFWILTMFIMPFIAVFFYIIQRDRLLRLGQKFS